MTVRRGSGGAGTAPGGDGIVREIEALVPCDVTLLSERRRFAPYGLAGGAPGAAPPFARALLFVATRSPLEAEPDNQDG